MFVEYPNKNMIYDIQKRPYAKNLCTKKAPALQRLSIVVKVIAML